MPNGVDNKSLFARHLEDWIVQVIRQKADGQNEKIPLLIKQEFDLLIKANIDYHRDMANALKDVNDQGHAMESFHTLMSDVYQRFLCS